MTINVGEEEGCIKPESRHELRLAFSDFRPCWTTVDDRKSKGSYACRRKLGKEKRRRQQSHFRHHHHQ
jgi:hypothetical protein